MANVSNVKVRRGNKLQLSGSTVEITGSTAIVGQLSASVVSASSFVGDGSGLTGLSLSGAAVTSFTAGDGLSSNASTGAITVSVNTGSGISIVSDAVAVDFNVVAGLTGATFTGPITGTTAYFNGDVVINGTASIVQLNTQNQTSLIVGDKYITILSGAADHTTLDGSGILWGSGSTGPTVDELGANAHLRYRNSLDALEIFPGLYVSGSTTLSDLSGTTAEFTSVTASSFVGNLVGTASNADLLDGLDSSAFVQSANLSSVAVTSVTPGDGLLGSSPLSGAVTLDIDTGVVVTLTGSQTISGQKTFTTALTSSGALFNGNVSGTTAQFTSLTASAMTITGSILIYGTASLAANPSAAYIVYESGIDSLIAFPGLYVSGTIATTGSISGSVFTGSGAGLTNVPASALSGVVAVAKGGTGLSSTPTNGQLLIGNGTGFTLATLTAGTDIGIATGSGAITVSFTGSTGTVSSILAGANIGIDDTNGPTVTVSLSSSLTGLTNVDSTAITGTNVLVNGSLKVTGSLARSIVTINSSYAVVGTDQVVFANITSSGDVVVSLPSPQEVDGREIVVKRTDNATQTGVVVVSASVNIDDATEYELAGGFQSVTLIANSGSNKWFVV